MVTGDQEEPTFVGPDENELAAASKQAETKCTCTWWTADTGTQFYSRIVKPDPDCPVHPARP